MKIKESIREMIEANNHRIDSELTFCGKEMFISTNKFDKQSVNI